MSLNIRLEQTIRRKAGITATAVDDELIMMDFPQNKYFGLNSVGAFVWNNIEDAISISDLCKLAMSEFDIEALECKQAILAFVSTLSDAALIEIDTSH